MPKEAAAETTTPVNKSLKADRLSNLMEKRAALEKQIAALQARDNAKARKDDTRLKVIVGAGHPGGYKAPPGNKGGRC